jgi:hypothetical protein
MKNIHLAPTSQPIQLITYEELLILKKESTKTVREVFQHVYITINEKPKDKDWVIEHNTSKKLPYIGKCFYPENDGTVTDEVLKRELLSVNYEGHYSTLAHEGNCKKIVLTNDARLIKDGVQEIDNTFLNWLAENPTCEYVEVTQSFNPKETVYGINTSPYKIVLPKGISYIDTTIYDCSLDYLSSVAFGERSTGYADEDFRAGANKMLELVPNIIQEYLETAFISTEQGYLNPNDWMAKRINKTA